MGVLGKLGKDRITGFEGIIIGNCEYLFGCNQYALTPQVYDHVIGKQAETEWFDEGRIEIIGNGVEAKDVSV